jgi:hypothetical protein
MNLFEELLKELSPLVGFPLHIDHHHVCCLWAGDTLKVQIEQNKEGHITLAAFLSELGPGKFREEVFKESLKANGQFIPGGVLSFSSKNNQLVLHHFVLREIMNAQNVFESMTALIHYGLQWQTALNEGKTAPAFLATKSLLPSVFGIKP